LFDRALMLDILRRYGVPEHLVNLIHLLHTDVTVRFAVSRVEAEISLTMGDLKATFFLSSIDNSALIDEVHRECAPDGGGTKSRVENQATGSGPGSRSRAQTRR
jgi:hypothetical protein